MSETQMFESLTLADIAEIRALAEECRRISEATEGGMVTEYPGLYRLGTEQQDVGIEGAGHQLYRRVAALTDEARHELTAVMWIGRGDEDPGNLAAAVQHARDMSDEGDIVYLISKEPLAEYLHVGLRRLATRPQP